MNTVIVSSLALAMIGACSSDSASGGGRSFGGAGGTNPGGCTTAPDCAGCASCAERCACTGTEQTTCDQVCSGMVSAGGAGGGIITGGTGGVGGAGGAPPPDGGCAADTVESDFKPPNLLFIIDRSGSMNCNLPPITTSADCELNPTQADPMMPSKWEIVIQALKDSFAALPPGASAGISFYNNNDQCGVNSFPSVNIAPLDQPQIDTLGMTLDAVTPAGGTPLVGSLVTAYRHLDERVDPNSNRFAILISDGAESCSTDKLPDLSTAVPLAASFGIRTFVIGAPGSEPARSLLSEIAKQGGTGSSATCTDDCHFDMTQTSDFATDLTAALGAISGQALTCEFDTPSAPGGTTVDFSKVNVKYTPGVGDAVDVLQDPDTACDSADGWQYADGNDKIVLCGPVCDQVKSDPQARIDILLGCETVVVR